MDTPSADRQFIIETLQKTRSEQRNITGAVRWHWDVIAPMIDSGYLQITSLARETGIPVNTLRGIVRRLRQAQRQQPNALPPASRSYLRAGEPVERSGAHQTAPTRDGAGVLVEKAPPAATQTGKPDRDGFIDLGGGKSYRRMPGNPRFFEVYMPGRDQPNLTEVEPKPDDPA